MKGLKILRMELKKNVSVAEKLYNQPKNGNRKIIISCSFLVIFA